MRRFATGRPSRPFMRVLRLLLGACIVAAVLPAAALLVTGVPLAFANPTNVSGLVFRDYNDNGVQDPREPGVPGVRVTGFFGTDGSVSVLTGADGTYLLSLPVPAGTGVRVEFDVPTNGFQSGAFGANSGTTVQFVTTPAQDVNLGILRPGQYCQAAAELNLVTSCFVLGHQLTDATGQPRTDPVIIDFPYEAGRPPRFADADQPNTHALMVPAHAVGTVWGMAYQRRSNSVFAGAFLKRHTGFGPGGPGAIYRLDPSDPDGNATVWIDLNAIFGDQTAGVDPRTDTSVEAYVTDPNAFALVGKAGLGDVEMFEDDRTLYVIALGDRRLYQLPVGEDGSPPAPSAIQRFDLPTPTGPDACPHDPATPAGELNLNLRPFGLGVYDGLLYVGVICTAESTQNPADLRAYVFAFDPAAGSFLPQPALSLPLNYDRGCAELPVANCLTNAPARWRPWVRAFDEATIIPGTAANRLTGMAPQPMFTGIDFDNGDMIIGMRDRYGDQMGNQAGDLNQLPPPYYLGIIAGEVLRACQTSPTSWVIEGSPGCAVGLANNQGPLGTEFYFQDNSRYHDEISMGSLLHVPGYPETAVTASDPIFNETYDGGVRWFNSADGAQAWVYRIYNSAADPVPPPLFGKTNGLGDLEALCKSAPVEIGNRVWFDLNQDGIQGPDEPPVPGVTLRLYDEQGNLLATAVTNDRGEYYFRGGPPTGDSNPNDHIGLLPGPVGFNTRYQIRIDNPADTAPGGPLYNWFLTYTERGDSRVRDSNGRWSSQDLVVFADVVTGDAGFNNHTYDFGFIQNPTRLRLESFSATPTDAGVELYWSTSAEVDTWGFHLYRSTTGDRGDAQRITTQLIPAQGRGQGGASYSWLDTGATPGRTYYYWLQEVERNGNTNEYGPASTNQPAVTRQRFYLPFVWR